MECLFSPSADPQASTGKRLEDAMRLGELCMEVLQQNDEHHSEVTSASICCYDNGSQTQFLLNFSTFIWEKSMQL